MKKIIFGLVFLITLAYFIFGYRQTDKAIQTPKVSINDKSSQSVNAQIVALYGLHELTASVNETPDWKSEFLLKQLSDLSRCVVVNNAVRWRCLRSEPRAIVLHDDSKVAICSILILGENLRDLNQASAVFGATEPYSKASILVKRNSLQITLKQDGDLRRLLDKVDGVKFEQFDKMLVISHTEEDEIRSIIKISELLLVVFYWLDCD